ncbi:MAG: hypothetical protein H6741_15840 [Alphaproteobacteria bacterium]|nr:hypothetical protein [Alphaproteobacteria bacterium]
MRLMISRLMILTGALLLVGLLQPAHAADCKRAYTVNELLEDTATMNAGLREKDKQQIQTVGAKLRAGVECMGEPVPPQMWATVYRMLGVYYAWGDTPQEAPLWFRTARELDPTYRWDINDISTASTTYALYEAARSYEGTAPAEIPGKEINVPANSKLLVDGRPLRDAALTTERYHVIQQVGQDNSVRSAWLIMGNNIPAQLLKDAPKDADEGKDDPEVVASNGARRSRKGPQELAGGYTTDDVVLVSRTRPPAKTPLMVLGGATLLAAGGVYAATFPARDAFDSATNVNDLDAARDLTNTLVLASGGVLALGLGVGTWGLLLDGDPTVGVTFTW